MWQTVVAAAAVLVSIPSAGVAVAAFRRGARVADVGAATAAQQVGLDYLTKSLETQQATITHQQGEIGRLSGRLDACQHERDKQDTKIAKQDDKIAEQTAMIHELQARLS